MPEIAPKRHVPLGRSEQRLRSPALLKAASVAGWGRKESSVGPFMGGVGSGEGGGQD